MFATKTLIKVMINTAIGVILILIWLQFVNIKEILVTLSGVEIIKLVPVFFFMLLSPVIRALRLKIFLAPIKNISLLELAFLNGLGMLFNFLIPIRGGEIAKGMYLNTAYKLPISKSLVWIFLDRFIDFLAVLILAAGLFFLIPTTLNITFVIIITIIFFIGLFLTYLMVYKSNFAKKMLSFLTKLLMVNSIKIYFERIYIFFLNSFVILKRKPRDIVFLFILTVLAYAADGAIWYFTFLALNAPQDFLKMYLGQILSALTYLVPAAPGYVGSAEASGLLIFSGVFGISPNLASSMTVLFHICIALFVLVFGIASVYFLKIDTGKVIKKILNRG